MEPVNNSKGSFYEGQEHFFEYAVIPYSSKTSIFPALEGMSYNAHFPAISTKAGDPLQRSFLKLNPSNVMLSGFYQDHNDLVIRIYEAEGKSTKGTLKFELPLVKASGTDCLGNIIREDIPLTENEIELNLKPFEIKTFLLSLSPEKV
jgi:alpha-mannosidase